jgi:hypothetical protein
MPQEIFMNQIVLQDVLMIIAISFYCLGLITFTIGIFILVTRSMSKDMRTLTTQTTQLAQKGLAEDVAGLVGNTTALMDAVSQMVRTTAGIGVFLSSVGFILMVIATWMFFQFKW